MKTANLRGWLGRIFRFPAINQLPRRRSRWASRHALPRNEAPADERVGREKTTDRDLAFATFAATGAAEPFGDGVIAAQATGKLTL